MVTSRFPRDSSRMPPAEDGLQRWLPKAIMAAAVALAAWLGTEWFWHFSSVGTPARATGPAQIKPRVDMANAAEVVAGSQLFGAPKVAVATAQVSTLNIKLKGVFAGDPSRPAFAIVNTGSRDEYALAGRELMPGVKLDSVHTSHVLVNRNGTIERVNLEERPLSSGGAPRLSPALMAPRPAPRVTPPPPPPPNPPAMNAPAPGQPGQPGQPAQPGGQPGAPSVNLNNLTPQTNFGRIGVRPDGVAVEAAPPGSMLANLGLQPGDVIRSVNGQAVTSEADLARIAQQAAANPSVQAEVMRGGRIVPLQAQLRR